MTYSGRDFRRESHRDELLARIAAGIEKLAEEPVIEMEVAPPVCPHCGTFNPEITTTDQAGTGPMIEYVIEAHCNECDTTFWASPVQWSVHTEISNMRQELRERADHVRGSDREHAAARAAS